MAELAVVVDPNVPGASERLLELDSEAELLPNVGLVGCELTDNEQNELVSVAGVLGVSARTGTWPVVEALERLLAIQSAAASAPIGAPNDDSIVGGLTEEQPYPSSRENSDVKPDIKPAAFQTRPAQMLVINMSLGPSNPEIPFGQLDPVNVATARASERVVLTVAAGNDSQRADGRETMSAWAEAPWVVAVGATTAKDGDALARYSSVGFPGVPDSGPDIVAWGSSGVDERVRGTSFAAPRSALQVLVIASALETLRHFAQRLRGGTVFGIPLVGIGLVDSDFAFLRTDKIEARALPAWAVNEQALADGLAEIESNQIQLDFTVTPARLRFVLQASAQPIPPYGPHEIGSGFVSDERTLVVLGAMTAAHLADIFGNPRPTPEIREALARHVLFDSEGLPALFDYTRRTAPAWQADIKTADVSRLVVEDFYSRRET